MNQADRAYHTVIVGGGQAGLSMSYLLSQQGTDHVILEKADNPAESWRSRWDSFTLVTPNWQLQLPGHPYQGDDPQGFLNRDEVVDYLEAYIDLFDPPLRHGVEVENVEELQQGQGFRIQSEEGIYRAENTVIAVGTFQFPNLPEFSRDIPEDIHHLHSSAYQNPESLPNGPVMVVGSGQSGCQLAEELHESGRRIYLCTSGATRLPRRYRGRDGMWWADQLGIMDQTMEDLDSPAERFNPNPHVSGQDGGKDINLHQFAQKGIRLLGRLNDIDGTTAKLGEDLHENLARADQFAEEFYQGVDKFVEKTGMEVPDENIHPLRDGYEQEEISELDLEAAGVQSILWATGFSWDYSWVKPASLDKHGYPIQHRGVTEVPGLYFLGQHFLHTRKSGLFYGVGDDAVHIANKIQAST